MDSAGAGGYSGFQPNYDSGPDPSWTDSSTPVQSDDDKDSQVCAESCWCGCSYCYDTFFVDSLQNSSGVFYHVGTVWGIHHRDQLHVGLAEAGFRPATNDTGRIPQCQWTKAMKVYKTGVYRGWLDVQDGRNTTGDPAALARISAVLQAQYPFVEILIICATVILPLLTLAALSAVGERQRGYSGSSSGMYGSEKQNRRIDRPRSVLRALRNKTRSMARVYHRITSRLRKRPPPPALLRLPDELHVNITDRLEFHDLRRLRATCGFYHSLITEDVLRERHNSHTNWLLSQEGKADRMPCWKCEQVKGKNDFRCEQLPGITGNRVCLWCELKAGTISTGRYYVVGTAGQSRNYVYNSSVQRAVVCLRCQKFSLLERYSTSYYSVSTNQHADNLCTACHKLVKDLQTAAVILRGAQFPFAIILFAVACSGSFPFHAWAFGITVAMVSSTFPDEKAG